MTITTSPDKPVRSDSATFPAKADAWVEWFSDEAVPGINAAIAAFNLNDVRDTSTSSVAIGSGSKSFTVSGGKSFAGGMWLVLADDAAPSTNSMVGQVTSYDSGTGALVVNVPTNGVFGSGTKTAWIISLTAAPSSAISAAMTPVAAAATLAAGRSALEVYSDTETDTAISDAIAALPAATPSHAFRNRCINGDFSVDQEYAAASTTFTAGAAYKRAIDMFYAWCTGANVTGQQVTVSGQKRYRFTGATSNTLVGFLHSIEAANSADLAGGGATFSVKLKSSSLTTVNWQAYYANTNDTFGTLASPTRTSIASGSFTITTTEARYAATLTGINSAATTGIEIALTTGALTAGNTLDVGEFQLEKGVVAVGDVVFETVDIALQEARCRHGFFEKVVMVVNTASAYITQVNFTKKRVNPTIGTASFNTGSGATFSLTGDKVLYQSANHSAIASATIPLTCGLHG